ncbi:MAG: formimidoylglutamate deiminase [Chloroflexota bacterium]
MKPSIYRKNNHLIMPGLATAHSHAFQRGLRGRTQRRATQANSFWSWRGLMYHLAERLDPDSIYALSHFAFVELAMSGVTAVGEFHYVHHDKNGNPYANRLAMSEAVIQAAKDAGIRITLIRAAYRRGGYQQAPTPAQERFSDPNVELILQDVAALQTKYGDDPFVNVALAAHSIRTVPLPEIMELADYARAQGLMFHMHVAEQRRELEECVAEHGATPTAVLANAGVLSPNFVSVHATHLSQAEIEQMGSAQAMACLCRTTERDLGDGLPQAGDMKAAGVRFCVGVDSHCCPDAFEEVRAVELDERSRTEQRIVAATAPELLSIGTQEGYVAIGMDDTWQEDEVWLRADDPALAGSDEELLADSVIFGATPRAVDQVFVAGQRIVDGGRHVAYESALREYEKVMAAM